MLQYVISKDQHLESCSVMEESRGMDWCGGRSLRPWGSECVGIDTVYGAKIFQIIIFHEKMKRTYNLPRLCKEFADTTGTASLHLGSDGSLLQI